ncbi:MAG: RadC family protein [Flavobacterium sp.]
MENSHFSIKFWAEDDRPREKMILKGRESLSDAELLAILLGSGSKNESAVDLSKRMLQSVDNHLNSLGKMSLKQLITFKGVGEAKAVTIAAAMELGRRRRMEEARQLPKISTSKTVFEIMHPMLSDLPHEEFWVLYLNNSNKVIYKSLLSKGGITGTVVDLRLIFKTALEQHAVGIILCHNHPSGRLEASEADKKITQKIKTAAVHLEIHLMDHLIITETSYLSFADQGIL